MRNKRYIWILFIFCSFSVLNVSANLDQRRNKIIRIVDKELREIKRLNRQIKGRDPQLLTRLTELYLEKARLLRDREVARFLKLNLKQRRRISKKNIHRQSNRYFLEAEKVGRLVLRKFKRFKDRGKIYYTLAVNAQDFQKREDKARKFFQQAIRNSPRNSSTAMKSKLALAGIYYGKKSYRKAIPLYRDALRNRKQKNWTKDAYNLAWCYFYTKQKNKAINLMGKVHRLSKNSSYVDMRSLTERDLAFFYSESKNIEKVADLYRGRGKDVSEGLLEVGRHLQSQGKIVAAERMFLGARRYSKSNQLKADVDLELLVLYEKFGKTGKHLIASKRLLKAYQKGNLSQEGLETLRYQVARMSGLLQRQVASKRYRKQKKTLHKKSQYTVEYFKIQSVLDKKEGYKAQFHIAETLYAAKKHNQAVRAYEVAYSSAEQAGDNKIANLSLDGMLASLGQKGISKATENQYLDKSYYLYLSKNPRDKRSFKIYQRLFSRYMKKGEVRKAEEVLFKFKKYFPDAFAKQEVMLAQIIDFYVKKGDKQGIARWVDKINNKEFKVSKKVVERLRLLFLKMQFDSVEKIGSKKKKLEGYKGIYDNKRSSAEARKNAAYNIAVILYEIDDVKYSYQWGMKALNMMDNKDIAKFQDSFVLIASNISDQGDYQRASKLYENMMGRFCLLKSKNKPIIFKNLVVLNLAEGNLDKIRGIIEKGKQCKIRNELITEALLDYSKDLIKAKRWGEYKLVLNELERDSTTWPYLIFMNYLLGKAYAEEGGRSLAKSTEDKVIDLYNKSVSRRKGIPLESLDAVAEIRLRKLRNAFAQLKSAKLTFPENKFQASVQNKFSLLDRIINFGSDVLKVGSGKGIVETYDIWVSSHRYLADEINSFIPPGKSKEYVTAFKKDMEQITKPILGQVNGYLAKGRSAILKDNILTSLNYKFLAKKSLPFQPYFILKQKGFIMDREGRR